MTQQFDTTNRGILSKNDRMTKETSPGYTGSLNVEGVEYFMDAWVKERKDGTGKFFSISLKRKDKQPQRQAPQRQEQRYADDRDPPF